MAYLGFRQQETERQWIISPGGSAAILAALISTSALTRASLCEEVVLDLVWPSKPWIVGPIKGAANRAIRKLLSVPADLIASTGLLVAAWAVWPAAATR
jgi:hypothetical protein